MISDMGAPFCVVYCKLRRRSRRRILDSRHNQRLLSWRPESPPPPPPPNSPTPPTPSTSKPRATCHVTTKQHFKYTTSIDIQKRATKMGLQSFIQNHMRQQRCHTPSITFRHLPPNSARFSYATEGALFISEQLSTDAVSALRKVRVLIWLWKQPSAQART